MNGNLKGLAAIVAATVIATGCGPKGEEAKTQYAACSPIANITAADIAPNFTTLEKKTLSEEERAALLARIQNGTIERQFGGLPKESQDRIISHLEQYSLEKTYIGSVAKEVHQAASMTEVSYALMPSLQDIGKFGAFEYDYFTKKINYFTPEAGLSFYAYLYGRSFVFAKAHEEFHAIQDKESKWYDIEKFLGQNLHTNEKGETTFELTAELEREFARQFLNKPEADSLEVSSALDKTVAEFSASTNIRHLIWEVQAYMVFEPYTNAEHLRQNMTAVGKYNTLLETATTQEFAAITKATLQLLGTVNPLIAAQMSGKYGESVEGYTTAVEGLITCLGYTPSQALQKGIERQEAAFASVSNIIGEAARQLQKAN